MERFRRTTVLVVCVLTQLLGCVMYPRERAYNDVTDAMAKVEELSASSATAYEVAVQLGEPLSYTQQRMRYRLCRDSTWGYLVIAAGPYGGGGLAGGPLPGHCYELTLEFDQQDRLSHYHLVDRPKHEDKRTAPKVLVERAESGDAEAQWQLYISTGSISYNVAWLCTAADQGHSDARRRVAFLYRSGWYGLEKDPIQAYVWYALSAASGNQVSTEDAKQVWQELAPSEREQAESLLSNWKPRLCQKDLSQTRGLESVPGFSYEDWLKQASGPDPDNINFGG